MGQTVPFPTTLPGFGHGGWPVVRILGVVLCDRCLDQISIIIILDILPNGRTWRGHQNR